MNVVAQEMKEGRFSQSGLQKHIEKLELSKTFQACSSGSHGLDVAPNEIQSTEGTEIAPELLIKILKLAEENDLYTKD